MFESNNKKVFLISGKFQAGKNTFSEYMKEIIEKKTNYKVSLESYAQLLKESCCEDFKLLIEYLNSLNVKELKTKKENFFENKNTLTRILLQLYGTNIFRNRIDNDYWVKKTIGKIKQINSEVVFLTDVRFENEISLPENDKDFDCVAIRIERDIERPANLVNHSSEISLDNYKFWDYIVENNGTLEELKESSKEVFKEVF